MFRSGWFYSIFVEGIGHTAHLDLRLYIQDTSDDIVEWCGSGGGSSWNLSVLYSSSMHLYTNHTSFRGGFRCAALPGSDILAYTRPITDSRGTVIKHPILSVFWAGADSVLHQRIFAPGWGWLDETPIAYLLKAGAYAGSNSGTKFRDSDSGCEYKKIQKIVCRSGDILDAIQVFYTDSTSTPMRGGSGGYQQEFVLSDGQSFQTSNQNYS